MFSLESRGAVGSTCLGGRLAFAFSACLAERRHFLSFSLSLFFSLLLHKMFGQHDGIKLGQISLQAHGIARRRTINSVDALTRLALIGSVLLKKFAILLLRRGMGGWMRRVCTGMGLLMFAKVHLACAVFNFSTLKITWPVAIFVTLEGGVNQSRLSGLQAYLMPSRSRLESFTHWKVKQSKVI